LELPGSPAILGVVMQIMPQARWAALAEVTGACIR
jgi:hypothetical protein